MFRHLLRVPPRLALRPLSRAAVFRPTPLLPRFHAAYSKSTVGENVDPLVDSVSSQQYHNISNEYLEGLFDELEVLGEEHHQIDVELAQGVMTLTVAPGKTYVINKQPPNKQIWWSSPISGPKRFDLIEGQWTTLRDGSKLTDLLAEELLLELGIDVDLPLEH